MIGLWFSLRTHASQIWQNPQQLLHPAEVTLDAQNQRISLYQRLLPGTFTKLNRKPSIINTSESRETSRSATPVPRAFDHQTGQSSHVPIPSQTSTSGQQGQYLTAPGVPTSGRRISYANPPSAQAQAALTPLLESVDHAIHDTGIQIPGNITPDDFTRAVAVATVSALRHQQNHAQSPARNRLASEVEAASAAGGHGGHEAPSWSRTTSASVLLACTALYAAIAGTSCTDCNCIGKRAYVHRFTEILVAVVDVVLEGSGIDEKFLGVTLFALVPNTTEFMNAMSFAMNGNIALRYDSCLDSMNLAHGLTMLSVWRLAPRTLCKFVCCKFPPWSLSRTGTLQTGWARFRTPSRKSSVCGVRQSCSCILCRLIFPRWDVISIILSVFLMTYTYIEAKSNYHRGSILIMRYAFDLSLSLCIHHTHVSRSYMVLVAGFYFAPQRTEDDTLMGDVMTQLPLVQSVQAFFNLH